MFCIFASEFQTVIMKQEDISTSYKSTQLISILNKNAEIIHELKKFMEEVSTRTSLRAHYCYTKNSFICERILTFDMYGYADNKRFKVQFTGSVTALF